MTDLHVALSQTEGPCTLDGNHCPGNSLITQLDHAGDAAHELAILLNSAYATLSDPKARQLYDADLKHMRQEIGSFDGRPVSAWQGRAGVLTLHHLTP